MKGKRSRQQKKHQKQSRANLYSKKWVKRESTQEDYEAFLASAGSWKGLVDADKLIADIYESRNLSTKPAVEF